MSVPMHLLIDLESRRRSIYLQVAESSRRDNKQQLPRTTLLDRRETVHELAAGDSAMRKVLCGPSPGKVAKKLGENQSVTIIIL